MYVALSRRVRHGLRMEKKDVRVQLVISQSEIEALDAWRAEHRIWSRSEAIRQLIADGVKPKAAKLKR